MKDAKLTKLPPANVATLKEHNIALQRIANKLGTEYGLKGGSDFRIKFQPWKRHAFKCRRFGSAVGVYFNVPFTHPEFEFYLRQALIAVAAEQADRPLPELASRLRERSDEHAAANPWLASMPKLVARSECEVTELYAVEVRHRATGLIVRRESSGPRFSKMVYEAREELTEMVAKVEELEKEIEVVRSEVTT